MDPAIRAASRFPEDLEANLRLAEMLAPTHCAGCNGYHLARARRRLKALSSDALDRNETVRLLQHCIARPTTGRVDILIAGAGDTNLLATCADAVADVTRARYTVLDRCRTPLALCEAFGRRHGLDVETGQIDMSSPAGVFAADVIVVHSLLRFLPQSAHLGAMRALRRWLKAEGAIIFSHRLIGPGTATDPGYLAEYQSIGPILALFSSAGLQVIASQETVEKGGPRHRFLALLKST